MEDATEFAFSCQINICLYHILGNGIVLSHGEDGASEALRELERQ